MNPKVTVIIASYNAQEYIARAIRSVLDQTEKDIEVIVVDDRSTDDTVKIVRGFSDTRLKFIINERNYGTQYSRNRALRQASGEWVAILDHDDWYSPERLERLLGSASACGADMIADDQYFIKKTESIPSRTLFSVSAERFTKPRQLDALDFIEADKKSVWKSPHFGLTKPLMKRSFLAEHGLEFNEKIEYVNDFYLDIMCLLSGARFFILPEPLYWHSMHKDQHSQQNKARQLKFLRRAVIDLMNVELSSMTHEVRSALSGYILIIDRDIDYFRLISFLKKRGVAKSLAMMIRHPQFFELLIAQLPRILYRLIWGHV
jgi:succinoglycan biosynthesis protein ExoO